jgi:hypothetical protein
MNRIGAFICYICFQDRNTTRLPVPAAKSSPPI